MQMKRDTVVVAVAMSAAIIAQLPAFSEGNAPSETASPASASTSASAQAPDPNPPNSNGGTSTPGDPSSSTGAATTTPAPRLEELRILQVVLQNIHAPGKNDLNSTINADADMQKTFQAIDKNVKLNDAAKRAQKDAYVHKRQRKSDRFNQLLQEKRIDWYAGYLDAINAECHDFWSSADYKDAETLSRLLNSRAVQSIKEMSQVVSDAVRAKLKSRILQLLDSPTNANAPSSETADAQAVASRVALVKKSLDSLHSSINIDELLDQNELINPDGKPGGDAKVQKFRQMVSGGKVDLANMYLTANVEEFDRQWSADDYKDLENLSKLTESKVFKSLEDGGALTQAVDHAVQKLPSILAPVKSQLQAEEKAGKFDPPAPVNQPPK